jgi:hypothetical protein
MKMIDVAEVAELAKDQMGRVDEKDKGKKVSGQNERGTNDRNASQKRRDERLRLPPPLPRLPRHHPRPNPKQRLWKLHRLQMIPRDTGFGGLVEIPGATRGAASHNYHDRHNNSNNNAGNTVGAKVGAGVLRQLHTQATRLAALAQRKINKSADDRFRVQLLSIVSTQHQPHRLIR